MFTLSFALCTKLLTNLMLDIGTHFNKLYYLIIVILINVIGVCMHTTFIKLSYNLIIIYVNDLLIFIVSNLNIDCSSIK